MCSAHASSCEVSINEQVWAQTTQAAKEKSSDLFHTTNAVGPKSWELPVTRPHWFSTSALLEAFQTHPHSNPRTRIIHHPNAPEMIIPSAHETNTWNSHLLISNQNLLITKFGTHYEFDHTVLNTFLNRFASRWHHANPKSIDISTNQQLISPILSNTPGLMPNAPEFYTNHDLHLNSASEEWNN